MCEEGHRFFFMFKLHRGEVLVFFHFDDNKEQWF